MLVGCGSSQPTTSLEMPAGRSPQAEAEPLLEPEPAPNLIPLYQPDEVLAALPQGREDPFAPPAQALGGVDGQADAGAITGIALTGITSVGGVVRAFVTYDGRSGPVGAGDEGGAGVPWLPIGVRVEAVDVQRGQLVLAVGEGDPWRIQL